MEELRYPHQTAKRKTKGASLFPKLNKVEISPVQSKLIGRGIGKKYCPQSIFKAKQEKPQLKCLRIGMEEQWVTKSKQYQQIQTEMIDCRKKHQQDISHIHKLKQEKDREINTRKKQSYNLKLSLWELKNQIFQLTDALKEEQQQYERLLNDLGYEEAEEGEQENPNHGEIYSNQDADQVEDPSREQDSDIIRNQICSTQSLRQRSEEDSYP